MTVRNHFLGYRPLVGGIAILNPSVNRLGTLGFFARSADGAAWIVSAAHVLTVALNGLVVDGEPIHQPVVQPGAAPVAWSVAARTDLALDVAAARLDPAVGWVPAVLGIGRLEAPIAPTVGMRVMKSGMGTAVTEGVITAVAGDAVTVKPVAEFASGYNLCDPGDSGAPWIEQGTRKLVAIHVRGNDSGAETAHAIGAKAALLALGLVPA